MFSLKMISILNYLLSILSVIILSFIKNEQSF